MRERRFLRRQRSLLLTAWAPSPERTYWVLKVAAIRAAGLARCRAGAPGAAEPGAVPARTAGGGSAPRAAQRPSASYKPVFYLMYVDMSGYRSIARQRPGSVTPFKIGLGGWGPDRRRAGPLPRANLSITTVPYPLVASGRASP